MVEARMKSTSIFQFGSLNPKGCWISIPYQPFRSPLDDAGTLCYAMLSMLCYVILWYGMVCYGMVCYVIYCIVLCCSKLY